MRLFYILSLTLSLISATPATAADTTTDVAKHIFVGNTDISLPNVIGFKEIYGTNPEFDRLTRQFVPQDNRLLAVYLSYADIKAMNEDPDAGFKRYILVQTPKTDLSINSPADFEVIKQEIVIDAGGQLSGDKKTQELLDNASGYMNDYYHKSTKLQVGETKNLGAFVNTDNSIALALLANLGVSTAEGQKDYALATALAAVNVKGKVVFANVYSNYDGAADAEFVRDSAKDFVTYTQALNGGATGLPAESGETAPFLNIVLMGAFVLALIILGVFLSPHIARLFKNRDTSV